MKHFKHSRIVNSIVKYFFLMLSMRCMQITGSFSSPTEKAAMIQWIEADAFLCWYCVPKQQTIHKSPNYAYDLEVFCCLLFKHHHIIVAFSLCLCWRCGIFKTLDCMMQPSNKHESLKFVLLIKRILSTLQANRMPKHFNENTSPCKNRMYFILLEYVIQEDCCY